jgi:hypothetical protein
VDRFLWRTNLLGSGDLLIMFVPIELQLRIPAST